VSEQILSGISTIRLYSEINIGSRWKIQDGRQIENTENIQTKHSPEKNKRLKTQQNKTTLVTLPL